MNRTLKHIAGKTKTTLKDLTSRSQSSQSAVIQHSSFARSQYFPNLERITPKQRQWMGIHKHQILALEGIFKKSV